MDGFRQGIEVDTRSYPTNYFKFTFNKYIYIFIFNNIKLLMPNLCLPPSISNIGQVSIQKARGMFFFYWRYFFHKYVGNYHGKLGGRNLGPHTFWGMDKKFPHVNTSIKKESNPNGLVWR